jgi:hypothetical protein
MLNRNKDIESFTNRLSGGAADNHYLNSTRIENGKLYTKASSEVLYNNGLHAITTREEEK